MPISELGSKQSKSFNPGPPVGTLSYLPRAAASSHHSHSFVSLPPTYYCQGTDYNMSSTTARSHSVSKGYGWKKILGNISLQRGGAYGKKGKEESSLVSGADVLSECRYIVLFFGCEWHPFCRSQFTPQLIQIYRHLKTERGGDPEQDVEIVYVSLDKDEKAYERFVRTMPWLSVPWDDAREQLIAAFRVQNVAVKLPQVVVLDTTDGLHTHNGIIHHNAFPEIQLRMNKDSDESLAKQFPWNVSKKAAACTACATLAFCSIQ